MKTLSVVALAVVSLLGACTNPSRNPDRLRDSLPDPTELGFDRASITAPVKCEVNVLVDDDEDIVITHEPVHTRRCNDASGGGRVKVIWKLPQPVAGGPVYSFAPTGVVFNKLPQPVPLPDCKPGASPQAYKCIFNGRTSLTFGYTIYVLKDGVLWKALDPHMVND
jgi:hypothetical protein